MKYKKQFEKEMGDKLYIWIIDGKVRTRKDLLIIQKMYIEWIENKLEKAERTIEILGDNEHTEYRIKQICSDYFNKGLE